MSHRHLGVVERELILRSKIQSVGRGLQKRNGFDGMRIVLRRMTQMVRPSNRSGHGVQVSSLITHYDRPFRRLACLPVHQEGLLCRAAPFAEVTNTDVLGGVFAEDCLRLHARLGHGGYMAGCQEARKCERPLHVRMGCGVRIVQSQKARAHSMIDVVEQLGTRFDLSRIT